MVGDEHPDALERFDEWDDFDPDVDEAPADYGFEGTCSGDAEEDT